MMRVPVFGLAFIVAASFRQAQHPCYGRSNQVDDGGTWVLDPPNDIGFAG